MPLHREDPDLYLGVMLLLYGAIPFYRETSTLDCRVMLLFYGLKSYCPPVLQRNEEKFSSLRMPHLSCELFRVGWLPLWMSIFLFPCSAWERHLGGSGLRGCHFIGRNGRGWSRWLAPGTIWEPGKWLNYFRNCRSSDCLGSAGWHWDCSDRVASVRMPFQVNYPAPVPPGLTCPR